MTGCFRDVVQFLAAPFTLSKSNPPPRPMFDEKTSPGSKQLREARAGCEFCLHRKFWSGHARSKQSFLGHSPNATARGLWHSQTHHTVPCRGLIELFRSVKPAQWPPTASPEQAFIFGRQADLTQCVQAGALSLVMHWFMQWSREQPTNWAMQDAQEPE